jgi:heme exporter protein A
LNDNKQNQSEPLVSVKSLSKTFGLKRVLSSLELDILAGISLCICGINGAGKSTLLKVIAGLLKPDAGVVSVGGYDIHRDPEKARPLLGMIWHQSMVYPNLTVRENLLFYAELYGLDDAANAIDQLMREVDIYSYRYEQTSVLSRGMLQRLAIARALVHRPGILLADEPFTGLDINASEHLVARLNDFTAAGGTVIMTSHNVELALKCCRRVVVLDKGSIIFDRQDDEFDVENFSRDYLRYAKGAE